MLVRLTLIGLVVILLLAPIIGWGAWEALHSMNDDAVSWTAEGLPARRHLDRFVKEFGGQDAVIVSWDGCHLGDPRLDRFRQSLTADPPEPDLRWLERVVTGTEIVDQMTGPPWNLSREEAIARLRGTLVGPDGTTSCALVVFSERASGRGRAVVDRILAAAESAGVDPQHVHLAGHLVETSAINEASLQTLYWLSIPSGVLVILVAWPFLKSLKLTLLVVISAAFCECAGLALVYYTGGRMNGMLAIMPILNMVIFVSGAVHLINYYIDAIDHVGEAAAPMRALKVGWRPCSLAVITTAIGVGSLALSRIEPIRLFGIYASAGMLLTLATLLVMIPGGLVLTTSRRGRGENGRIVPRRRDPPRTDPDPGHWVAVALFVERHAGILVAAAVVLMLVGAFGVTRLQGSMQMEDFFAADSKVARDHAWLEANLGPLMPLEVVLRIGPDSSLSPSERLLLVRKVQTSLEEMPMRAATVSLANYLPKLTSSGSMRSTAQRGVLNRRFLKDREQIAEETHYMTLVGDEESWRITARLESVGGERYEEMLAKARTAVEDALKRVPPEELDGVSVTYTGMLPLLAESHPVLMRDLVVSFGFSFVVICGLLSVGLRSVRIGLVSMVPNLFPILVVFGAVGLLRFAIDPGTMMTAGVGLGIAVDGTVHFLTWFLRALKEGKPRIESITSAYRHCGTAIFRTTIICAGGLAVYALSSFAPAARFGVLICLLLVAAMVGDLVFLPAMLTGRVGKRVFPERE